MNAKQYRKERDKLTSDINRFYYDVYWAVADLITLYPDSKKVAELKKIVDDF